MIDHEVAVACWVEENSVGGGSRLLGGTGQENPARGVQSRTALSSCQYAACHGAHAVRAQLQVLKDRIEERILTLLLSMSPSFLAMPAQRLVPCPWHPVSSASCRTAPSSSRLPAARWDDASRTSRVAGPVPLRSRSTSIAGGFCG